MLQLIIQYKFAQGYHAGSVNEFNGVPAKTGLDPFHQVTQALKIATYLSVWKVNRKKIGWKILWQCESVNCKVISFKCT